MEVNELSSIMYLLEVLNGWAEWARDTENGTILAPRVKLMNQLGDRVGEIYPTDDGFAVAFGSD